MEPSINRLLGDVPIHFVYVLHGDDEILYVGRTEQMRQRLRNHLKRLEFGHKIKSVDIYSALTKRESYDLERRLIQSLNPTHNKKRPRVIKLPHIPKPRPRTNSKLTDEQREDIASRYHKNGNRSNARDLSIEFGVSLQYLHLVLRNHNNH